MSSVWKTIAQSLLGLTLLCMLNCCTHPKTHSRPKVQELPVPVEVKPEIAAVVPETPSEIVPSPSTPEPFFHIHMVRWPGETFSIIAQWYTGSWKNWKALSNANPTIDPNRIVIGVNIFIPEDLLKSRKPMPPSFLSSSVPKKGVQSFPSEKPSKKSNAVELYGTIETKQALIKSNAIEPDPMELFEPIETEQALIKSDAIEPDPIELFEPIETKQALIKSDAIELFEPTE